MLRQFLNSHAFFSVFYVLLLVRDTLLFISQFFPDASSADLAVA